MTTSFTALHDAFQHIKDSGNKFPTVRCVYVEPGVQDDILETAAKVGYRFRIGRAQRWRPVGKGRRAPQ